MSIPHSPPPDGLVTIDSSDGEKCRVTVDPKSAESLIHFLLERDIRLLPPEGGVVRNPEYQLEMAGVPQMHSFFAYDAAERLEQLKDEWHAQRFRLGI